MKEQTIHQKIYGFLNSKAVKEHFEKIQYQFSTPAAAFVVYASKRPWEDKKDAWDKIVREMPDCSMGERHNMQAIPSFHQFLQKYMELMDRETERFCNDPTGAVYTYAIYGKNYCGELDWMEADRYFASFSSCMDFYRKGDREDAEKVKITKYYLDSADDNNPYGKKVILHLNREEEVLFIDLDSSEDLISEDDHLLNIDFDGMWFDFPLPFKRGDIITVGNPYVGPVVLDYIQTWSHEEYLANGFDDSWSHVKEIKEQKRKWKERGDTSDMGAGQVRWDPDTGVYMDYELDLALNFDYYDGPLDGTKRGLKVISEFLKTGEGKGIVNSSIDLEFSANALMAISLEEESCRRAKKLMRNFAKEYAEKVGLGHLC